MGAGVARASEGSMAKGGRLAEAADASREFIHTPQAMPSDTAAETAKTKVAAPDGLPAPTRAFPRRDDAGGDTRAASADPTAMSESEGSLIS